MTDKQYHDFMSCRAKVYRFARSLTKNVSDAEDIYQDTLLKLWELRAQWHTWRSFEAYAMRMVRNAFLNKEKKEARYQLLSVEDVDDILSDSETDANIESEDSMTRFKAMISRLPAIQQEILHLREIEEMEYKEIAEVLEISEAQVRVYLFRARQFLKAKYHGRK